MAKLCKTSSRNPLSRRNLEEVDPSYGHNDHPPSPNPHDPTIVATEPIRFSCYDSNTKSVPTPSPVARRRYFDLPKKVLKTSPKPLHQLPTVEHIEVGPCDLWITMYLLVIHWPTRSLYSAFLKNNVKKREMLFPDFARVRQFYALYIRNMRHTNVSRTNVNPTRMFRIGLTPTLHDPYLRDRQSRTWNFTSKANLASKTSPI